MPKSGITGRFSHQFLILNIRRKSPPKAFGDFQTTICIVTPPLILRICSRHTHRQSTKMPRETTMHLPEKWQKSESLPPTLLQRSPESDFRLFQTQQSHPFLIQYILQRVVWKPESRRQCRRLSYYFLRFLTSHS